MVFISVVIVPVFLHRVYCIYTSKSYFPITNPYAQIQHTGIATDSTGELPSIINSLINP